MRFPLGQGLLGGVTVLGGRSWSGPEGLPWSTATVCTCVIASVRPIPVRSSGEPCRIFGRSSHQFWRGAVGESVRCLPCCNPGPDQSLALHPPAYGWSRAKEEDYLGRRA